MLAKETDPKINFIVFTYQYMSNHCNMWIFKKCEIFLIWHSWNSKALDTFQRNVECSKPMLICYEVF